MKIILANPRGFCAGVNMAIQCVERMLQLKGAPLYVFHEIVHNRHVVDRFTRRGVVFVDSVEDVPAGSTLVYSAHGISPAVPTITRSPPASAARRPRSRRRRRSARPPSAPRAAPC